MTNKIKYQGGITKILGQKIAEWHKYKFRKNISNICIIPPNTKKLYFEVISFSGAIGFEDQILSIYSFIYYAGIPIKWTIYSDKTYTADQKKTILKLFPFVIMLDWDTYKWYEEKDALNDYLSVNFMAKK